MKNSASLRKIVQAFAGGGCGLRLFMLLVLCYGYCLCCWYFVALRFCGYNKSDVVVLICCLDSLGFFIGTTNMGVSVYYVVWKNRRCNKCRLIFQVCCSVFWCKQQIEELLFNLLFRKIASATNSGISIWFVVWHFCLYNKPLKYHLICCITSFFQSAYQENLQCFAW